MKNFRFLIWRNDLKKTDVFKIIAKTRESGRKKLQKLIDFDNKKFNRQTKILD